MNTPHHQLALAVALLLSGCVGTSASKARMTALHAKAAQGDAVAQFELGAAYDNGLADKKHDAEAVAWYRKAAEQGHAAAQSSLGSMYQYGEGVPQDFAEAARWYQQAADQDYGEACANLGYLYDLGLGVPQDRQKGVQLYQRGAEQGSLNAMLNLGVSYTQGQGVEKDLVQAHMWLDLARFYTQHSSDEQLKWRVRAMLAELKRAMTGEQLREADRLASAWDEAHRPQ